MISVVIPTFNRQDRLAALLADLSSQSDVALEVIVVDDNSTDGTEAWLRTTYPSVAYIRNSENRGPAVCRNLGIRRAAGDVIVGLDSDVSLPDTQLLLRVQRAFAEMPALHAAAFRVFDAEGRNDDAPRWWHPRPLATHAGRCFETDYFSGTAFAFRRSEILSVGAFPENIFQYYEEVELAYRFLDAGGVILYRPDLWVLHHPGKRGEGWSDHRMVHHPRSLVLFTAAAFPLLRGATFLMPRLANALLKAIKTHRISLYFRGLKSATQDLPSTWKERRPLHRGTWRRIAALRTARG